MSFHSISTKEILLKLESNAETGLCKTCAENRLEIHGKNKLTEKKKKSLALRFFEQFKDFMVMILIFAAAISALLSVFSDEHDYIDSVIILAIVVVNAVLGLIQESKAEKSLEALKKMSSPTAKVLREGVVSVISAENLVPGDIILLEAGSAVPADARLLTCHSLQAEEAALTGESLPSEKNSDKLLPENTIAADRSNMVFFGSMISYGKATAIVTQTGMNTEVGKIASRIMDNDTPETPLQKRLAATGKTLGLICLAICVVIFFAGVMRSVPPFDMFMTSISLAVAAIPEGLPAIVTVVLAMGVQRMVKYNAIIRKLPAVETLGQATVICSDKTGTLTLNKMTVTELSDGFSKLSGGHGDKLLKFGALCTDCSFDGSAYLGDPTETAIARAAESAGIHKKELESEFHRIGELPFDSVRKLMTTVFRHKNEYITVTKGAPDVLIEKCSRYDANEKKAPLTIREKRLILQTNAKMASSALRVIAVAYAAHTEAPNGFSAEKTETELTFLGLIGMIDPPREEAYEAVKTCIESGIKPVMITGDHALTAKAIARELGIMHNGGKVLTGSDLSKMSWNELRENVQDCSVFARVSPENKMDIVKAFQENGEIVAMTGDGVNDAPSLKAADIGCAMGLSGTDAAKGAADMILTDDNFATIVHAIREGRSVFSSIKKSVHFLLSSNIGEIITIFAAILLGWKTPLLAIHLLWVNLVTDSLPAIALGLDPCEAGIMKRKPFSHEKSLFSDGLWQKILFQGGMIGMLAILAFGIGSIYFDIPGEHIIGSTMAFATLSISQLVHAFNMRSEASVFSIDLLGNPYLIGALIAGVILQATVISFAPLAVIFKVTQLRPIEWLFVTILCLMPIVIVELEKSFSLKGARVKAEV